MYNLTHLPLIIIQTTFQLIITSYSIFLYIIYTQILLHNIFIKLYTKYKKLIY